MPTYKNGSQPLKRLKTIGKWNRWEIMDVDCFEITGRNWNLSELKTLLAVSHTQSEHVEISSDTGWYIIIHFKSANNIFLNVTTKEIRVMPPHERWEILKNKNLPPNVKENVM